MEPLTPEAIIKKAIESGGGRAVFALLYTKEEVLDVQKDALIYLTYAKDDEDAKRITEEHIKKAGKEDFLFQKLVGLAQIPLTPNPIIEVLRELNPVCTNPNHDHSKDSPGTIKAPDSTAPLMTHNIEGVGCNGLADCSVFVHQAVEEEKEKPKVEFVLPKRTKEDFIYSIRLLVDRSDATKEERKVVDKLIVQFNKNFDAERPTSS